MAGCTVTLTRFLTLSAASLLCWFGIVLIALVLA
jgi:hypothetical protein